MQTNNKSKQFLSIIKVLLALICLLVLTLVMVYLPELFYKSEDKKLKNEVKEDTFSMNSVTSPMNEEQVKKALLDPSTIVVESDETYTEADIEVWVPKLAESISSVLTDDWENSFLLQINSENTSIILTGVKLIRVENDEIFVTEIGVLNYYDNSETGVPGIIIFDMTTGRLIEIQLFRNIDISIQEEPKENTELVYDMAIELESGISDVFFVLEEMKKYEENYIVSYTDYICISPLMYIAPQIEQEQNEDKFPYFDSNPIISRLEEIGWNKQAVFY
ncbi:MAG: hypothetical protein Q4D54_05850 [Eubacteriales bacterium]|nr:hypothetical protein [Eubacteriales bacterium]